MAAKETPEYIIEFSRRIIILPEPILGEEKDKLRERSAKWFLWIALKMFKDSIDFRLKTTALKVKGTTWKLRTFGDSIRAIKNIITLAVFEGEDPSKSIKFISNDSNKGVTEPDSLHLAFRSVIGCVDLDKEPIPPRPTTELGIRVHDETDKVRKDRWEEQRKFREYREQEPPERELWRRKLEYGKVEIGLYPETVKFDGLDMEEESIDEFVRAFNNSDPKTPLQLKTEHRVSNSYSGGNSVDVLKLERELNIRGWIVNITIDKFPNPELPADIFIDKSQFLRSRVRENSCFIEITEFGAIIIKFYGAKRPAIKELLEKSFEEPAYYFMLRADAGMVFGDLRIDLDDQLAPLMRKLKGIGLEVTFVKTHWHFRRDQWDWWRYPEVNMDREIYLQPENAPFNMSEEDLIEEKENKIKLDKMRKYVESIAGKRGWV
jgi:hypothetical protein